MGVAPGCFVPHLPISAIYWLIWMKPTSFNHKFFIDYVCLKIPDWITQTDILSHFLPQQSYIRVQLASWSQTLWNVWLHKAKRSTTFGFIKPSAPERLVSWSQMFQSIWLHEALTYDCQNQSQCENGSQLEKAGHNMWPRVIAFSFI